MSSVSIVLEARTSLPAKPSDVSRHDITGNPCTRILCDEHGNITFQDCSLPQSSQGSGQRLALIAIDGCRVSFEANIDGFTVSPPEAESLPASHTITLPVSAPQHRISTILRPGDCIRFNDDQHGLQFDFVLKIDDSVKVRSSLPLLHDESFEVPETQQRPDVPARRTQMKQTTKRTAVQVEQSMQGSGYLRPATPAPTTQQSVVVAETPATTRKIPLDAVDAKDGPPHPAVDPKDVMSTNISTPTEVGDSFADRPKQRRVIHALPPLRSFTSAGQAEDSAEETTASETEGGTGTDEGQDKENADFSTAPEGKRGKIEGTRSTLASMVHESSTASLQDMDVTTDKTDSFSTTEEGADEEATPKAKPRRTLRAKPDPKSQPQVRIPPSRGTKRASPEVVVRERPKKKSKKAREEEEELGGSLASSIKIRIDSNPTSAAPVPSSRRMERTKEEETTAPLEGSQRSLNSSINVISPYHGNAPRVAFSNTKVIEREGSLNFLRKKGVQAVDKVTEKACDIVCIGANNGSYVKSAKLLLGLALGKTVVADTWVLSSRQAGKLLDPSRFPPLNAPNEWGWGDEEERVSGVLNIDRSKLFKGKVFFFTAALKREYGGGFSDIEQIAKACGARIMSKSAREYRHADNNNIILASENTDLEAMALMNAGKDQGEQHHHQCYSKDLISTSVLRGSLDLENDGFKIQPSNSQSKRGRRPAARKAK